jgi:FkbM family methyltransferase
LYRRAHASFGYRLRTVPGVLAAVSVLFRLASRILPRTIEVCGSHMYVDPHEATFFIAVMSKNCDPFMTEVFKKVVKEGDAVVDLGANVGYYSLLASRIVGKQGRVYAFEPDPKTYSLLVKNIKLNKYENIIPVPKAVTNYVGTAKFFLSAEPGANSLYKEGGQTKFIEVETQTLDSFFGAKESAIGVIKMDIEGGEIDAISGMDRLLSQNRRLSLFIEFVPRHIQRSGHTPAEFLDKLWKLNFEVFAIDEAKKHMTRVDSLDQLMGIHSNLISINLLATRPHGGA